MLRFQSPPFSVAQKAPVNEPPPGSPSGSIMVRVAHFHSLLFLHISQVPHKSSPDNTLLSKALRKEGPFMFPKTGPLWKQTTISTALLSISFGVPSKGAPFQVSLTELPQRGKLHLHSPSSSFSQSLC
jgi:hypothetical protein